MTPEQKRLLENLAAAIEANPHSTLRCEGDKVAPALRAAIASPITAPTARYAGDDPLPCPFCGASPKEYDVEGDTVIECTNDACRIQPSYSPTPYRESRSDAIKAWNTRLAPPITPEAK